MYLLFGYFLHALLTRFIMDTTFDLPPADFSGFNEQDLIDYLAGNLPPTRQRGIEQWLNESEEAEALLRGIQEAQRLGIHLPDVQTRLVERVNAFEHPTANAPKRPPVQVWLRYAMQAAAVLAGAVIVWLGYDFSQLNARQLFQEQFAIHAFEYSRAKSASPQEVSSAIERFYMEGQYDSCIQLFERQLAVANGSAVNNFFVGNAYLHQKQPEKALLCFQQVLTINQYSPDRYYHDDSEYYLALSYLANDQLEEAAKQTRAIVQNPQHKRYVAAQQLLRKIRLLELKEGF